MNEKTILITGGTGLLGSQFVEYFLNKGYITIFTSKNISKTAKLQNFFHEKYKSNLLHGIVVDHELVDSIDTIINYLLQKNVWPDSLVNNVINLKYQAVDPITKMTLRKDWLGELLMDIVIPYELSQQLVNHPKSSLKTIVNISSMYGVVARHPNLYLNPDKESPIQYGVAKAGLIHLTKELAVRFAQKKVRVNCISYGGVEGRVDKEFKKRYAHLSPSGEMLKKEEITGAVEFLSSNASIGMTGQNIIVDGGWTIW